MVQGTNVPNTTWKTLEHHFQGPVLYALVITLLFPRWNVWIHCISVFEFSIDQFLISERKNSKTLTISPSAITVLCPPFQNINIVLTCIPRQPFSSLPVNATPNWIPLQALNFISGVPKDQCYETDSFPQQFRFRLFWESRVGFVFHKNQLSKNLRHPTTLLIRWRKHILYYPFCLYTATTMLFRYIL